MILYKLIIYAVLCLIPMILTEAVGIPHEIALVLFLVAFVVIVFIAKFMYFWNKAKEEVAHERWIERQLRN